MKNGRIVFMVLFCFQLKVLSNSFAKAEEGSWVDLDHFEVVVKNEMEIKKIGMDYEIFSREGNILQIYVPSKKSDSFHVTYPGAWLVEKNTGNNISRMLI